MHIKQNIFKDYIDVSIDRRIYGNHARNKLLTKCSPLDVEIWHIINIVLYGWTTCNTLPNVYWVTGSYSICYSVTSVKCSWFRFLWWIQVYKFVLIPSTCEWNKNNCLSGFCCIWRRLIGWYGLLLVKLIWKVKLRYAREGKRKPRKPFRKHIENNLLTQYVSSASPSSASILIYGLPCNRKTSKRKKKDIR